MASATVRFEWRWRGFHSGEWAIIDIDLDNTEASTVAVAGPAIAVATVPPPAGEILAGVLALHSAQIVAANKGSGVHLHIEAAIGAPIPTVNVDISSR